MSRLRVEIDRLHLSLEGVPRSTVDEAVANLGTELRSQLARTRWTDFQDAPVEIDRVTIVAPSRSIEPGALRALIVERITEQITRALDREEKP